PILALVQALSILQAHLRELHGEFLVALVQGDEYVAGFNRLPWLEIDGNDFARCSRMNGNRLHRPRRPDRLYTGQRRAELQRLDDYPYCPVDNLRTVGRSFGAARQRKRKDSCSGKRCICTSLHSAIPEL